MSSEVTVRTQSGLMYGMGLWNFNGLRTHHGRGGRRDVAMVARGSPSPSPLHAASVLDAAAATPASAAPIPDEGRQRTSIVAYALRPREQRLDLMLEYSTGQRVREIRLRRRSPRVVVADAVLTQQGPQDLRVGCVSVRWPAAPGTNVLQRGRRVPRALRHRRVCRRAAAVDANVTVDVALRPVPILPSPIGRPI